MSLCLRTLTFFALFIFPLLVRAQTDGMKDSLVQINGIVVSADSSRPMPLVSVSVVGTRRGTLTNENGLFGIVVLIGNELEFSSVGYKSKRFTVTSSFKGSQHDIVQYLEVDTTYLAPTVIKAYPSRRQFERDFVNAPVNTQAQDVAKENLNPDMLQALQASTPKSASEMTGATLRSNAEKYHLTGQVPPMKVLDVVTWIKFIKSLKH